jgi:hypothetical protein
MLGITQEMKVRLLPWIEVATAAGDEALERALRPFLADIAPYHRGEFLDPDRRAPQAETRRLGCESRRNEQVGLQLLDRRRPTLQREHKIGRDVENEA